MLGSFGLWCLWLTLIFKESGQKGLGYFFFPLFHSFFLTTLKSSDFQCRLHAVHIRITYPLTPARPSLLILALNSIKISADLISTLSIIYQFLLIFFIHPFLHLFPYKDFDITYLCYTTLLPTNTNM